MSEANDVEIIPSNEENEINKENLPNFNIQKQESLIAEKIDKKQENLIKNLYNILDYNLENFHSSMWNEESELILKDFIESKESIYMWVEEEKLKKLQRFPEMVDIKN